MHHNQCNGAALFVFADMVRQIAACTTQQVAVFNAGKASVLSGFKHKQG
jgi:hypothetical protein